ncbi:ATP-dependent DNA helicase [Melia azedarach]|uniref:ATP-dependent DNA helicase n=1 Tax=Melia azedarach TaxID=155640 RepID=A0ACC1Y7K5_MELAZ|nr:ATP-dependent DNA helicase [Melia azedarach]
MISSMESVLKKYFGYSEFRPYQKEVIQKIVAEKKDCLVVMATGSGKSLCYQVPPLITGRTAVVVSPLISLMQDQVMSLKQRGIKAEFLSSSQTDPTVQTKAETGHFHLLFMTPEKACIIPVSFWSKLLKSGICLLAVDEAHCISEWGHDFRLEYKQLDKLRAFLLNVPFVGLTATATEKVRMDIINSLKMKDPYVSIGSFDRKNLFYWASDGSTIIYCMTIKDVEQIFKALQEVGIKAGIYHGQMGNKARQEVPQRLTVVRSKLKHFLFLRLFVRDEVRIMVATIAFGMGIDKPDIRHVINYGCPKSLESYYQESGRCGRDGIASACWLYYSRSDFAKANFYCGESQTENQRRAIMESLQAAQRYCLLTTCRRKFLLGHFGENYSAEKCGNCDNCMAPNRECDMSRESYLLMSCIRACGGHWGLNIPIDVLRGSRAKKVVDAQFDNLPLHGLGKDYTSNWWKTLAYQLISYGYLTETVKDVYKTVSVSPKGEQYLSAARPDYQPPLVLPLTGEMVDGKEHENTSNRVGDLKSVTTLEKEGFSEAEAQLYHMLLEERMKLARVTGTAPYALCGDQTIKKIALTRPSTKARLANIDGVNQHLVMAHGDHLLETIRQVSEKLNLSLNGEAGVLTASTRKLYPVANQRKLTPAKYEAWKMWHEDGLSIQKIANDPGRPCSNKRTNCSGVSDAISKVGSRDKLKPIKNELPDNVTYAHIKAFLAMQNCGIYPDAISPFNDKPKTDELLSKASEPCSTDTCCAKEPRVVEESTAAFTVAGVEEPDLPIACDD